MTLPPKEIFKAYDIRGVVGRTLTPEYVEFIGRAIGSEAHERGVTAIAIGRDGRLSGPALAEALASGIQGTGINVIDVGRVATPMLYFAAYELGTYSGVMVTGSHNPPDYNGLKMMLGGETLAGDVIQALRTRLETGCLHQGSGSLEARDVTEAYLSRIASDVKLARPMKIVVDCGNGVAGAFAPELYRRLGCDVRELFCEVDGSFPNHHPDPSVPENLEDVIHALKTTNAEIGLAFDGDGDRLGVVTKDGTIIYPDRQLMLFAADVLSRNPGAIVIYDVKSTRNLAPWIREHGGKPVLCRTGHSFIKAKMRETGALLAGEMSGHVFFKERWYGFDDGLYAGARLLEILARTGKTVAELLADLPPSYSTPEIRIDCPDDVKFRVAEAVCARFRAEGRELIDIDGVRVRFPHGWGLLRASNTQPMLVMRFEADTPEHLADYRRLFEEAVAGARAEVGC